MSIRLKSSEKNVSSKCGTEFKKLKKSFQKFWKRSQIRNEFLNCANVIHFTMRRYEFHLQKLINIFYGITKNFDTFIFRKSGLISISGLIFVSGRCWGLLEVWRRPVSSTRCWRYWELHWKLRPQINLKI